MIMPSLLDFPSVNFKNNKLSVMYSYIFGCKIVFESILFMRYVFTSFLPRLCGQKPKDFLRSFEHDLDCT